MKRFGKLIKSDAALEAEEAGLFTLSQFQRMTQDDINVALGYAIHDVGDVAPEVSDFLASLKKKDLKQLIIKSWGGEWHHTSKCANQTAYYDWQDLINYCIENDLSLICEEMEQDKRKALEAKEVKEVSGEYEEWNNRAKSFDSYTFKKGYLYNNWIYFPKWVKNEKNERVCQPFSVANRNNPEYVAFKKRADGKHITFTVLETEKKGA